jgi:ribose/xylose/arabinose/galactoside ABC-type transport system permease subunit
VIAGWIFLSHTVAGREIFALGGNEEAARFSGLPVGRIKLRVFALSGLAAGIAGMVSTGYYGSANTATGEGYELTVIAAAVVGGIALTGGRGSVYFALVGALILSFVNKIIFFANISSAYQTLVGGAIVILAIAASQAYTLSSRRAMRAEGRLK